ncbi:MAG: hypothetical protein RQ723_05490, partial [Desulfuromonadales bacterium]|nr:hypothetical protein [Desulfuromonadales bacterium]
VEAGDADGNWSVAEVVTLNVVDVNELVTSGQTFSYAENQLADAVVGTVVPSNEGVTVTDFRFNASDADPTDPQLSSDGYFRITSTGEILINGQADGSPALTENNDFELDANSFTYGIEIGDASGNWYTAESVTLNVTDVDEIPPVVVTGQMFSYEENQPLDGAVIGTIAA